MKKLIIVAITLLALTSCNNDYIEDGKNLVKNQKELTNLELLSKIDTANMYYIVLDDSKLITINSKTKIVEHRIMDSSGSLSTLLIILLVIFVVFLSFSVFRI